MGSTTKLVIGEVTGSQSAGLVIQKDGGNVGIGTSVPSQNLHVSSSGNTTLRVQGSSGYYGALNVKGGSGDSAWVWQPADTSELRFFTVDDDRITILGTGNVGVSTNTPIAKLDVAGKIAITSESATPSQPSDGQGYLYTKTDGKLYWRSYDVSETDLTSGGGGSSTDRFVMTQAIEQVSSMSTSYYYYKNVVGGYGWTNTFSTTNFSTSFPYWRVGRYASSGVIPIASDLTAYHLVGHKDSSDNDTINLKVWKVPAPTNGDAETDIPTLVEIISIEIDVDGNEIFNKSGTLSSSNSFVAGDQWMITLNANAYMTGEHYAHLSLVFEPS